MTVAIAWERYVAVHYPIDYNQGTFIDSLGMFRSFQLGTENFTM